MREDLDETFRFKLHQRLSDRNPAHSELGSEGILPELKACLEFTIDNPTPQISGNGRGDRPMLKGFLSRVGWGLGCNCHEP
jgi:hypothetical protein